MWEREPHPCMSHSVYHRKKSQQTNTCMKEKNVLDIWTSIIDHLLSHSVKSDMVGGYCCDLRVGRSCNKTVDCQIFLHSIRRPAVQSVSLAEPFYVAEKHISFLLLVRNVLRSYWKTQVTECFQASGYWPLFFCWTHANSSTVTDFSSLFLFGLRIVLLD